jgi:minimal CRISPR polymerase-like protein
MASKKVQIRYWLVDAKQLTFWLTVAFVAGAGPNLVGAISTIALLAVMLLAAAIAGLLWLQNKRKSGIGVFIHLRRPVDPPIIDPVLKSIRKTMVKRHRDWFRSGPDIINLSAYERVEWTIATIRHRLDEAEILNDENVPVFLYIHCRLVESFILGQTTARHWEGIPNITSNPAHDSAHPKIALDFHVRSISNYRQAAETEYSVNLDVIGIRRKEPYSIHVETHRSLQDKFGMPTVRIPNLALIIYAGPTDNWAAFQGAALEAAAGRASRGYAIDESTQCDSAVVMSITDDKFFSALREGAAENYIRQVVQYWQEQAGKLYGRVDVPVRVFMNAPSIVAFIIGSLAPPGSSFVAFDHNLAIKRDDAIGTIPNVVAIIDGDDVGNGMEHHLLSNQLTDAINYSERIDSSLSQLEERLVKLPNVRSLSSGGDSAIFSFPAESLQAFAATLDQLRAELNFHVSCGYGYSSRAAYMALRVAKSSGKNRTEGWLDAQRDQDD